MAPASFDLVHSRFQVAPLGRADAQVDAYLALLKPGGWLVLEDPDASSWQVHPSCGATAELVALILQAFEAGGGDFNSGRRLPELLRARGIQPRIRARVVALEPAHPYLRLPLQFAQALKPRLEKLVAADSFAALLASVERELAQPGAWGTTFTLIQAFGPKPSRLRR